uniref:Cytochrome P450 2F5-like n=1 Tax=Petromyzon marinus TaxID=7757 RepID=A0AAJ7TWV3_PETMA|nr:cytochrome P450 2F5-like [Petromyzon marinus]
MRCGAVAPAAATVAAAVVFTVRVAMSVDASLSAGLGGSSSWVSSCLLLLIFMVWFAQRLLGGDSKRFPPGPRPWPLLGNLMQVNLHAPYETLTKLAETYGPVYSVSLGPRRSVVLAGYEAVREALVLHADDFSDRPIVPLHRDLSSYKGLVFAQSEQARIRRRFSLSVLRTLGMGKRSVEAVVAEEAEALLQRFKDMDGKPFETMIHINLATGNVICSITLGKRFDISDTQIIHLLELLNSNVQTMGNAWAQVYNAFPLLKHFPGPHKQLFKDKQRFFDFLQVYMDEHRAERTPNEPRDYIDAFIDKQAEEEAGMRSTTFDNESFLACITSLFQAGTETTANSLRLGLFYMITFPDVQKRVQEEIDCVVGPLRLPTFADRDALPYTHAVVHEVQRFANIVPIAVPHATTNDVTFRGFFLPKGTPVIALLHSVLRDKSQWERPDQFYPEHFLDAAGRFRKRDAFMPFSAGRRMCMGESLARTELFVFLSALLQNFSFHAPPGRPLPKLTLCPGFVLSAPAYELCAISRI